MVAGDPDQEPLTYTPVTDEKEYLLLVSRQIRTECKQFYRPDLKLKSGCGYWDFFSWGSASENYTSKATIFELNSCFDFWINTEEAETWPIPPRLGCLILRIDMTEVMDEGPEIGPGESWHEFLAESRAAGLSGSKGQTEAEEVRDILRDDPAISSVIRQNVPLQRDFDIQYEISFGAIGLSKVQLVRYNLERIELTFINKLSSTQRHGSFWINQKVSSDSREMTVILTA